MEIVKTFNNDMPEVKLIGKRYIDEDRDASGAFVRHGEAFLREGIFDILKKCERIPGVSEDLVGVIRVAEGDGFEYWIGALLAPTAEVPDGLESLDIPAGKLGVCWRYGNDKNGELYRMQFDPAELIVWGVIEAIFWF